MSSLNTDEWPPHPSVVAARWWQSPREALGALLGLQAPIQNEENPRPAELGQGRHRNDDSSPFPGVRGVQGIAQPAPELGIKPPPLQGLNHKTGSPAKM